MPLSEAIINNYTAILKEELVPAMGCTEPIAIAYAASIMRRVLGTEPSAVKLGLSGNIIKNVKSVIVPATGGMHGILSAVAAGVIAACPEKRLEVLGELTKEQRIRIAEYCDTVEMELYEIVSDLVFEIDMMGSFGDDTARVQLEGGHTNVVYVEKNGKDLTAEYLSAQNIVKNATDRSALNVKDIVEFASSVDLAATGLDFYLERQLELNMNIAKEGLCGDYGATIGKILLSRDPSDVKLRARAYAAAGSDARMNGCELPVCIISGSGNQGMTASLPVAIYAEEIGASHERLLRALLVSDLITIHQKTGIGCLSAYCGAVSAGCGCGCGICYLNGGGYYEVAHTLVNSVAMLSGTICDGAKASCAAKIAMAVEAGIMGYEMTLAKKQFYGGDGIVTKGVENTIKNVARLARDGMSGTDREIIKIMLEQGSKN